MQTNRSRGQPSCQAAFFPTGAMASDEECYKYIHDTVVAIRQGRAELSDLNGIRQVTEIMRLKHQELREAEIGPIARRLRT